MVRARHPSCAGGEPTGITAGQVSDQMRYRVGDEPDVIVRWAEAGHADPEMRNRTFGERNVPSP